MADEQNESLQQDQQGAELKGVTPLQKDHTSELKGAAPLPKDHASPLPKDHSSPSELKGAAPLQKDHTSESSVDENVPPAETLQSATVLDGHAIEEVAPVNPDGTGPGNEVGAGAAGNDDQDGVLYTCCRDLWNCLYGEQFGRPYFLMAQAVVTFILVLFCAYEARGVSSADDSYQWEIAGPVFGSCVYVVASVILFGHKQQLKTTYENARTKLANYLCCFKGLRALLVVGMLRVFVHVSDILGERKNLDAFGLAFYYLSALHVITVAKLFTIEDILCLSDSLIAVGVLVSSRIEVEPLGKDDMHGALVKKVVVLVCGYVLVILVVCFKYATVPYGNQPEEPAAGARADETGQAGDRAAVTGTGGTGPRNEAGAEAAGNNAEVPAGGGGVLYTCCRDLWASLYGEQFGKPYFLMAQAVVTFILVLFCAYEARGVSSADDSYQWEIAGPVFGSCVYVVASVILFGHKQQLKTTYENARTKLANYLCGFKGLRALLVVGMLRVFVHVSDILGERKNLDAFGLAFYYLSALHVITVAKLFTIEDILCLSDSLIAVGVLVSSRIEVEPLGKDDMHGALVKKVAVLVCGYVLVILVVCFKYATVPYGNQPEEPAAGARADETGQAGDRAAVTGTGGTELDASDNA